jgi:hypothetical protein
MRYIIPIIMVLMIAGTAAAVEKIRPLTIIPLEDLSNNNALPKGIYSVDEIIDTEIKENADLDFLNLLTNGAINQRRTLVTSPFPQIIQNVRCSEEPDISQAIRLEYPEDEVCYVNEQEFPVTVYIFDISNNIRFTTEARINIGEQGCLKLEPGRTYLADVHYCSPEDCQCGEFQNLRCNSNMEMVRGRVCEPAACKDEEIVANWIDTSVEGCEDTKNLCKETDSGVDYSHYGKAKSGSEEGEDRCLSPEILMEYYCSQNTVQSKTHYCLDDQECVDGECVSAGKESCGKVDGEWRYSGDEWCVGGKKKDCQGTEIKGESHNDCKERVCNYNGIILQEGQSVCMGDATTIATCIDPKSDSPFTYTICEGEKRCTPNGKGNDCQKLVIQEQPTKKRMWSFMDLIRKLFDQ